MRKRQNAFQSSSEINREETDCNERLCLFLSDKSIFGQGAAKKALTAELALAGVQALADFVKEIGMPTTFAEMGITDRQVLKEVADTCNLSAGCCKKLSREEILQILEECL